MNSNLPAWDDARWTSLPPLDGARVEADVCVIGLGGSGLSAIEALLDEGTSVIGVDAHDVGAGAAGRNGGFLLAGLARFHHHVVERLGRPLAANIYQATLDELERVRRATPDHVRITGSLRIADDESELADCHLHLRSLREDGFDAVEYEGPEGRGLLIPTDGVFNPLARVRRLALRCIERGARLFGRSPVVSWEQGRVVCDSGEVMCDTVLICVDGRLERLVPELSSRVRTARLQMIGTAPLNAVRFTRPVYARCGYEYWQQLPDGGVVLGGFRDLGGDAEWTSETTTTTPVQHALERLLRERLQIDAPITHRWAASVAYTESGVPVIDEIRPRVWVTGAYSGTGNIVGALCARAIVAKITRSESAQLDMMLQVQAAASRGERL